MLRVHSTPSHILHEGRLPSGLVLEQPSPALITSAPENLRQKHMLIGVGYGPQGLPIDLATLFLAGTQTKEFTVLVVDEFQRLNGMPEDEVILGRERLFKALTLMNDVYQTGARLLLASHFMHSQEYLGTFQEISDKINSAGLTKQMLECVPEKFRANTTAASYPWHEISCTEFLRREIGMQVKLGPSKEKVYDTVMEALNLSFEFAYLCEALPVGVANPRAVVHYIPGHIGKIGSQRLFLDEEPEAMLEKLQSGSPQSLRYLLRVASVAGRQLGNLWCSETEIQALGDEALLRVTTSLVAQNIVKPLRALSHKELSYA